MDKEKYEFEDCDAWLKTENGIMLLGILSNDGGNLKLSNELKDKRQEEALKFFKKKPKSSISQLSYYTSTGEKGKDQDSSFTERVILPVFSGFGRFIRRIGPKGIIESNRRKLIMAGMYSPYGVDVFLAIKFLLPLGFIFLLIILTVFTDISVMARIALLIIAILSFIIRLNCF